MEKLTTYTSFRQKCVVNPNTSRDASAILRQDSMKCFEDQKARSSKVSSDQDYYSSAVNGIVEDFRSGNAVVLGSTNLNELEQSFNWDADGSSVLNDDQIAYLQNKYNLSNMGEKDYLNLMMDLNRMNAITAEDIILQYVGIESKELHEKGVVVIAGGEYMDLSNTPARGGNILSASKNYLSLLNRALDGVIKHYDQFSTDTFFFYKESLEHKIALYNKLDDIFDMIR